MIKIRERGPMRDNWNKNNVNFNHTKMKEPVSHPLIWKGALRVSSPYMELSSWTPGRAGGVKHMKKRNHEKDIITN